MEHLLSITQSLDRPGFWNIPKVIYAKKRNFSLRLKEPSCLTNEFLLSMTIRVY